MPLITKKVPFSTSGRIQDWTAHPHSDQIHHCQGMCGNTHIFVCLRIWPLDCWTSSMSSHSSNSCEMAFLKNSRENAE